MSPSARRQALLIGYAAGRLRAEASAKHERDDLVTRFEEINEATRSELRALRSEIARMHTLDGAGAAERDEARWLH